MYDVDRMVDTYGQLTNAQIAEVTSMLFGDGANVSVFGTTLHNLYTDGVVLGSLGTEVFTDAPDHESLFIGLNIKADPSGYVPINSTKTAWGLGFETNFYDSANKFAQQEFYITDGGSKRALNVGTAQIVSGSISIVAGVVTISEISVSLLASIKAGMRFMVSGLTGASGISAATYYYIIAITGNTCTFDDVAGGSTPVNATLTSGTMTIGGCSTVGMTCPVTINCSATISDADALTVMDHPAGNGVAYLLIRGSVPSKPPSIYLINDLDAAVGTYIEYGDLVNGSWRTGKGTGVGAAGLETTFSFCELNSGPKPWFQINTGGKVAVGYNAARTALSVVDIAASTTARASLHLESGTAPTAPNNGDIWFDGTHFYGRTGGVSVQLDN